MFRIYLKTGYRNLLKYKSFSVINLIGLSLGFSAIMVLAFMLYQFITVNSQFRNKDRMFYVRTKTDDGRMYKNTPYPFMDEVLKICPEIEAGTHMQSFNWPWLKNGEKEFQEQTWYVDSGFFKVFTFPLAHGNAAGALRDKYSVVLSHEMAMKLFGNSDAVGKNLSADDSTQLTVTAVLQPVPSNSTFRPQVLLTTALLRDNANFNNMADWYNTFAENYFLLKPGASPEKVSKQMNGIVQTHYDASHRKVKLLLTPFTDYVKNEAGEITQVIIKGEIGTILFILLIIVANLVNLNAATMLSRAKEVAVKQMVGSSKRQIIWQFCVENSLLVFTSLVLAFLLFQSVLLPQINNIIESRFGTLLPDMQRDYPLAFWFIGLGFLIVVIAGSYPAFHLVSLKVTNIVKGEIGGGRRKYYGKNIFVTLQFVLAITFIGVTIILSRQMEHMKTAALGFNKDNVLVIPMQLAYKNGDAAHARFNVLLNDLRANSYVKGISTSEDIPTAYHENYNTFFDPAGNKEVNIRNAYVDAGLLPTYEIPMVQGRNFKNVPVQQEQGNIIINRKAMEAFGWKDAIGKQIKSKGSDETLTVVGVMEDFHYRDLTRNVEPLMHVYAEQQQLGFTYLSVRIDPQHTNDIVTQLQNGFNAMPSRRQFSYEFISARIDNQYALLTGILKVTNFVSLLTIFIAAMGMFGLIALFAKQRVKEIGIRKVLGARVSDIMRMLLQNYVVLILIATFIAAPMVWLVMSRWLQDFAYRIDISIWMPVAAGLIALVVAMVIVIFQATKAARANPVKSLRSQ